MIGKLTQTEFEIFCDKGFPPGRLISGSKSSYRVRNPDNIVLFNANIIVRSRGKIWHGDLDLTKDEKDLREIAKEIGEDLFVLFEMDARFSNEDSEIDWLMARAYKVIKCE